MRKMLCTILLAILVLQSTVLASNLAVSPSAVDRRPAGPSFVAQEPGSRLEPDEYTNHVPILIDESSDFSSQGWPGSGTEVNPYVFQGLSIHYDVDLPLIHIINVDDYFVVRDCLLIQNSTDGAVVFVNITHGVIEYCDVYSVGDGIYLENAANAVIDHVEVEAYDNSFHAVACYDSDSVEVAESLVRNLGYVGMYVNNSHSFDSRGTTYTGASGRVCLQIWNSNGATSIDDTVGPFGLGLDLAYCNDMLFSGLMAPMITNGFAMFMCNGLVLEHAEIMASTNAVTVNDCVGVNITDSTMTGPGDNIISLMNSNNSLVSGNVLYDSGDCGIYLNSCFEMSVVDNEISDIDSRGIWAEFSDSLIIEGNYIADTGGDGIRLITCDGIVIHSNRIDSPGAFPIWLVSAHNGEITFNDIGNKSGNVGIAMQPGENWTIADNHFEDLWGALFADSGCRNIDLYRNDVVDVGSYWFALLDCVDTNIVNNSLRDSNSWGLHISGAAHRTLVQGNTLDAAESSIYALADNITIEDNQILNSGYYAINTNSGTENLQVIGNHILNSGSHAFYLTGATGPVFRDNVIDGAERGVYVSGLAYAIFENNNFTDCGIHFSKDMGFSNYNHSFIGNHVNGKPFYYAINEDGLNLDGNEYGEIMLVNCTNSNISGGEFINSTSSILLFHCNEIDISSTVSQFNWYPFLFDNCNKVTLSDSVLSDNTDQFGMTVADNVDFVLDNVTVRDMIGQAAIFFSSTLGFTVQDCSFSNIGGIAIYAAASFYGWIEDCDIVDTSTGISMLATQDSVITNNSIKWSHFAIYAGSASHNFNVTLNNLHDNEYGVYIENTDAWNIVNNLILWNSIAGIYMDDCSPTDVSLNTLHNIGQNGIDDGSITNFWDNGTNTGNYWSDFTGVPPYPVPGSANSVDRYPLFFEVTEPIINEPEDISYAEFSEGNELVWYLFDDNLRNWEVRIDSQFWQGDAWNFANVAVNIDGLAYGTHTVDIIVWDLSGNNVTDTVIVTVFDDIDPTISSPHNAIIFYGVAGNEIVWYVDDQNPDTYELFRDGEVFVTGDWSSGTHSISLDGLSEGEHEFTLAIYDVDGNMASDTVIIHVITDTAGPELNSPDDVNCTVGTTGNYIVWTATDQFPSHWVVTENNTVFAEGNWGGTSIILNIDDLNVGHYTFVIIIYDTSGNSATDAVDVTVIPLGGWQPVAPPDFTSLIVAAVVVGAVVAIVGVVFLRKRRPAS